MASEFDLIVLGLGPGGEEVAGRLAEAGRSVLAVDPGLVGGECPYYGCVPSKMMLRAAEVLAETRRVNALAGHAAAVADFAPVAKRIRDEATDNWDDRVAVERLEGKGARFVRGAGALAGCGENGRLRVRVGDAEFSGDRVVVATGTSPAIPPIRGLRDLPRGVDALVWTNREAVQARDVPDSLIVLGGGAIGCELAQVFARFGSRVSVVEAAPRILLPEEPEASQVVADVFRREGVDVREGVSVESAAAGGDGVVLTFADGQTISANRVLVAAGRTPNLDIGLDTVGLDPTAKSLDTDEHLRVCHDNSPVDGLFAVGDITGRGAFTHVAVWQARVLAAHLLGEPEPFGGYHAVAWATFTDPEVGRVGLTEAQARERGLRVRTGSEPMPANARGWLHGAGNDGLIKVVEDADRGVLVGATVVGPHGGEVLGLLTLAVHAAVPVSTLATMHYAYPTLHRGILDAVRTLA